MKQNIQINSPVLWRLEQPHIYTDITRLKVNNKIIDRYKSTFGIRNIETTGEKGLLLNGKTIKLKGVNTHHDNGLLGAESHAWSEERKVLLLKQVGVNSIRFSHETVLNMCDKYAVLAIDEAFDEWRVPKKRGYSSVFNNLWIEGIEAMSKRDRNYHEGHKQPKCFQTM